MTSRSLLWRRIGVGAVATATMVAGLPLLLAGPAHAANTTRLLLTPTNQTVAAGTCALFTITPLDDNGQQATDTPTVTIRASENPESDVQDVDFCEIPGTTTTPLNGSAFYYNGVVNEDPDQQMTTRPGQARFKRDYVPGTGITPDINTNHPGGNPDSADNTDEQPNDGIFLSDYNTNPSGQDYAQFRVPHGGQIKFGLVGLRLGGAQIEAWIESGSIHPAFPPTRGTSEATFVRGALTFTNGGAAGSQQAADAVTVLDAEPETGAAVVGTTQFFTAELRNNTGHTVAGVQPHIRVSGANAAPGDQVRSDCGPSSNNGISTCAFQGRKTGTDTLTVFVNRTSGTAGPDPAEAQDDVTRTTSPPPNQNPSQARNVDLQPDSAVTSAGTSRTFTAIVTDVNGTNVQGVAVQFTEDGPGSFAGGAAAPVVLTDNTGRAQVVVNTAAGQTGTQTITATISAANTDCDLPAGSPEGSSAGDCNDSSTHTIVAATASPTPTPSGTASPRPTTSASPTTTTSPAPSGTPTTDVAARYRGLDSPVRVLDTRSNNGARRSGAIVLDLSSRIPDANATSAVLNVTVTNPTARGFLVAYPNGTNKPGTSNVNFEANQTQANEVVVRMSSDKRVTLFVDSASAHVIADLVGSFTSTVSNETGRIVTNAPDRAFDSRTTAQATRTGEVVVNLSDQLPAGATGAVLNVTVTRTSARGFVTVYPTGTTRPGTSNVNFERGQTQANEVITQVGTGSNAGRVSFFIDSASASLIVDVVGAVAGNTGQTFTALASPQRALDTRDNRGARRTGAFDLTMPSSVPASATGVILNVTATNGTRPGFVTVYPGGTANPGTSNVNFPTNLTQANEVTSGLGADNRVTLFVGGANFPAAHVIVDVVGYLTG